MAWVYVIQNAEGRFYVGMTTDLDERLRDHNSGVSKWTKYRAPWRLVWSQECATIGAAERVKAFSGIERAARLKLDRLEAAATIGDLAALPGNRFENLKGGRKGQCSIRINDQWRICFEWPAGSPGPVNVEIVDYH
jgi:toxin HigB-1